MKEYSRSISIQNGGSDVRFERRHVFSQACFFWWDKICIASIEYTRDITERDRRQKFRPNQNVLRDVTSRWSMRITAHSSDS